MEADCGYEVNANLVMIAEINGPAFRTVKRWFAYGEKIAVSCFV